MQFTVLIPARLASTRLPNKPLADILGVPMVVRVAQQALQSGAMQVVVAADSPQIVNACAAFDIPALLTRPDHLSGSDRLAEACHLLALGDDNIVVNVQGDEPLIEPALIRAVAGLLGAQKECAMSTAAHPIREQGEFLDPHVVKVVVNARHEALYFSRASIPATRDGSSDVRGNSRDVWHGGLRHVGIYAYRVGFLQRFPHLQPAPYELTESLEQLRALWHGYRIAVHITNTAPGLGVDTLQDLERVRMILSSNGLP